MSVTLKAKCSNLQETLQLEGLVTICPTLERSYYIEDKGSLFSRTVQSATIKIFISKGQGDDDFFKIGKEYKIEISEV